MRKVLPLLIFVAFLFQANSAQAAKPGDHSVDSLELSNDLFIVWPLVKIVKNEYDLAKTQLEFCNNKVDRKAYMESFESFVKKKYLKTVMSLNIRQGKLLLLLIHRELDKTPYDLLKEYRSKQRASFWQKLAIISGADLKAVYTVEAYPLIEHAIHKLNASDPLAFP